MWVLLASWPGPAGRNRAGLCRARPLRTATCGEAMPDHRHPVRSPQLLWRPTVRPSLGTTVVRTAVRPDSTRGACRPRSTRSAAPWVEGAAVPPAHPLAELHLVAHGVPDLLRRDTVGECLVGRPVAEWKQGELGRQRPSVGRAERLLQRLAELRVLHRTRVPRRPPPAHRHPAGE